LSNFDKIILKMIAKNPDDRYQTAAELIEHLDQIETGTPIPNVVLPATAAVVTPSVSPPSLAALVGTVWVTPYVLSHDHVVACPTDLPAVCDAAWDRAVDHFAKGYITKWLRDGVDSLRAAYRHGLADDLERIVGRAEGIVRRVQNGDDDTRNAGLEEFLESLGATKPVLEVTPKELNLLTVGIGEVGRPVALTITNEGRGYLSGSVVCRVPWLQAATRRFGCKAGERCEVRVKPNLSSLLVGRTRRAQALWVRSVGGDQFLMAQVDILPAVLEVDAVQADGMLDFGTVGWGEVAQTRFTLRNGGQGYLMGEICCQVPWLAVSPEQFKVAAGDSVQVTVEADSRPLRPGDVSHAQALVVESNGGRAILDARMQVLSPRLSVKPAQVYLETIDLAQPGAGKTVELTVRNTGRGVLTGKVTAMAEWLDIEPVAFRCQAGKTQQLHLSTARLRTGDYHQIVRVDSNVGMAEVPVLLRVCFSLEPEMVLVPAGEFLRGSKERDRAGLPSEKPQCRISLATYWIGKYPVTNAQYAVFVETVGRRSPEHWEGDRPPKGKEDHPVVNVSWWDAVAYCRWLAEITGEPYRLPTEAQWEKAARGTDGWVYPWGNRWNKQRCNTRAGGKGGTAPVGTCSPAGDSPYGCADMAGNVLEWVSDWYKEDYYARSSVSEDPHGPASGAVKVLRGGSWSDDALAVRSAHRVCGNRKLTSPEIGFRCALAAKSTDSSSSA